MNSGRADSDAVGEAPVTQPFLEGERVWLRPLALSDADGPYPNWLNDATVCSRNSHHVRPYSRDQARAYILEVNASQRDLVLAVIRRGDRRHIGNVSLGGIHPLWRKAEFAILIGDRTAWGQGLGREAAELLLHHGFSALNLHRIECGTFASNDSMQKLAKQLGMTQEGVRRQAAYKGGAFVDVIEFGVLSEEYLKRDRQ